MRETRLAVHYSTYAVWIVDSMLHRDRTQNVLAQVKRPASPEGNFQRLPLQARVLLEFIPSVANETGG